MAQTDERSAHSEQADARFVDLNCLVKVHGAVLFRRALKLTRRHDEAWDLLQEVLLRALERKPRAMPLDKIRNWLLVVMGNLHIDRCRRASRRKLVPLDEGSVAAPFPIEESEQPSWRTVDYDQVLRCLCELKPVFREAYLLHDEQGLSLADTAERMSVPVSTAGTRVFRARRNLRALLEASR